MIRLQRDKITNRRREVFQSLRDQAIGANVHYIPVHTQPYYQNMGFQQGDFPHSEAYYQKAVSLPLFQTLTEFQQDQVMAALCKAVAA